MVIVQKSPLRRGDVKTRSAISLGGCWWSVDLLPDVFMVSLPSSPCPFSPFNQPITSALLLKNFTPFRGWFAGSRVKESQDEFHAKNATFHFRIIPDTKWSFPLPLIPHCPPSADGGTLFAWVSGFTGLRSPVPGPPTTVNREP